MDISNLFEDSLSVNEPPLSLISSELQLTQASNSKRHLV